jgi:O-antigen/teichoic acid export membrane protein
VATTIEGKAAVAMRWRALQLGGVELIYFLRLLILAKILAPQDFGVVAIAVTSVGIFMRLTDLGMIPALVQARDASTAHYDGAWTVGLLRAAGVTIALITTAPLIARLFAVPDAVPIIQALACRPLIDAAASIGVARLMKELEFRRLALMQLPAALVDLLVAVQFAHVLGVWAIVAGTLSGALTSMIVSYFVAPRVPRLSFRFSELMPLIRFGRWILITGIIALASTTLTQVFVSRGLGAAALGTYFLALKVAFLPSEAASAIVGSVAFPAFSQLRGELDRTIAAFRQLFAGLLLVLMPVYAFIFVLAPSLADVLDVKWAAATPVIRVLAVSCVIGSFGGLLVQLMLSQGRSDAAFRLELIQTAVLITIAWPLIHTMGLTGAAVAWLVANFAAAIGGVVWLRTAMPSPEPIDFRLVGCAAIAAAGGAIVTASIWPAIPGLVGVLVAGVGGVLTATAIVLLLARLMDLNLNTVIAWLRVST